MKHLLAILLLAACAVSARGQTIKSLGYNTTNGYVIGPTSGVLLFTNEANFPTAGANTVEVFSDLFVADEATLTFDGGGQDGWRSALGLGATWLTNTNVTNFRTAIGYNNYPDEGGAAVQSAIALWDNVLEEVGLYIVDGDPIFGPTSGAGSWRTNLSLGSTNIVTFAGLTNNGDITINQTATNNGLLYIRRTNNEAFLGLANLIASNNTTISNETLFRVGTAEATNRSAQFGFRSTNTNGEGVAVFSVFGYNALMMIGPSDPAAGTNPIQATVYSVAPTNKVMTLITTNTGAMLMHRPIGIDTAGVSTNAPANTTNVAGWIEFYVGTNSVRVPYYQ
jgi:hypothetical protein